MGSSAVPLRLIPGGAPGTPLSPARRAGAVVRRVSFPGPPASRRRPSAEPDGRVVDLAVRRRAAHVGELRRLLEGADRLWSALWRSYPGREREVVELHLRFDGVRDATMAWATGSEAAAPREGIAAQLEGVAVLGAPARGAATWRALCRQLELLEDRVATLDFAVDP